MTETEKKRHEAAKKAADTYRKHREKQAEMEAQRKAEQAAQIAALRRVRDNLDSSSADVLRAVELLAQMESR